MGVVLDAARSKLNLSQGNQAVPQNKKTTIEMIQDAQDQLDQQNITELQRLTLKKRIAEMKRELSTEISPGSPSAQSITVNTATEKTEMMNMALQMLNSGVDPVIVNKFLASSPVLNGPAVNSTNEAVSMLTTIIKELKSVFTPPVPAGNGNSEVTELIKIIKEERQNQQNEILKNLVAMNQTMIKKIEFIETNRNSVPITAAKTKIFLPVGKQWIQKDIGPDEALILPPIETPPEGKTVEEIREENRHREKMEEINQSKEKSENMGKMIGQVAEGLTTIAAAAAAQAGINTPKTKANQSSMLDTFKCEKCGFSIPVPPGATSITCPACKEIYKDSESDPKVTPQVNPGAVKNPNSLSGPIMEVQPEQDLQQKPIHDEQENFDNQENNA